MFDLKEYKDVLVSEVKHNFSERWHANIPTQLFLDWAKLLIKIVQVIEPNFVVQPLPPFINFTTESISSDGPYPASENYYYLDYYYFQHLGEKGFGVKISFEDGRQGGGEPVCMETIGLKYNVSSYIEKDSIKPLAKFFIWHDDDKTDQIEKVFNDFQRIFLQLENVAENLTQPRNQ